MKKTLLLLLVAIIFDATNPLNACAGAGSDDGASAGAGGKANRNQIPSKLLESHDDNEENEGTAHGPASKRARTESAISAYAVETPLLDHEIIDLEKESCVCVNEVVCDSCNKVLRFLFNKIFPELQLRNPLWRSCYDESHFTCEAIKRTFLPTLGITTTYRITIVHTRTGIMLPYPPMQLIRTRKGTPGGGISRCYFTFSIEGPESKIFNSFTFASHERGFIKACEKQVSEPS